MCGVSFRGASNCGTIARMPHSDAGAGRDTGLLDATFVDACRLLWSPASLPQLAMTLPVRLALLAGAIGWFTFGGAGFAAMMVASGDSMRDTDERLLLFIRSFFLGGMVTAFVVIPLALFASLDADLTSEHHRTRIRFLLLLPAPLLLPLLAWGFCTVEKIPVAGSPWWLAVLGVALLVLMQRGWNKMHARSQGEHCVGCGYLLLGLPEPRCPECGREFYPGQTVK